MGKKRKQRLCHICKKRPIWIGGDVKNPGPVCKRCYHERVWPERLKRGGQAKQGSAAAEPTEAVAMKLGSNLRVSRSKRWIAAMRRYRLTLEELAMAQATNFEPRLMHKVATGQSVKRGAKLPTEASRDESRRVKREIRERYAGIENNRGLPLVIKLSLTLPADLVARMQSECDSKRLKLGDEIRAFLESRFPGKTELPAECPSEPAAPQPSGPAPTGQSQLRLVRRTVVKCDA